ncbi:transposase [Actinopolyspora biskrensis]|uniref:Transposase n=1 Tax=Actinopolyspora biskrensis TaxID=1470178 RepID=A0A852Z160_9ACTN|nr:transposase [Actinopolyspora biskrensis]
MAAPWIVSDGLWERIEPLLPVRPASKTGPKPLPDRAVLQGTLFVLYTGIGWEDLPQELGFGSGDDLLATLTGLGCSRCV